MTAFGWLDTNTHMHTVMLRNTQHALSLVSTDPRYRDQRHRQIVPHVQTLTFALFFCREDRDVKKPFFFFSLRQRHDTVRSNEVTLAEVRSAEVSSTGRSSAVQRQQYRATHSMRYSRPITSLFRKAAFRIRESSRSAPASASPVRHIGHMSPTRLIAGASQA